jgi:hypothetical protein
MLGHASVQQTQRYLNCYEMDANSPEMPHIHGIFLTFAAE